MTAAPTWNIIERHIDRAGNVVSLSFHASYQGRQCRLDIALPQPINGQTDEAKVAMQEFQHLHDALGHILAEHKL